MEGKVNIHDLIDEWHEAPEDGVGLPTFLGLTSEQYKRWVESGDLPHGCNLYDSNHDAGARAREDDRRLRGKARRRALNRLAGRHRDEYLRLLNEEVKRMREEARGMRDSNAD
jgi:hypothetical protein